MRDYFSEKRYELRRVYFQHLNGYYSGDGIMYWKPDKGFTVEARVRRHGPPPPRANHFMALKVPDDTDFSLLRMNLLSGEHATARVRIDEPLFGCSSNWFTIDAPTVVFWRPRSGGKPTERWYGSGLYNPCARLTLPHSIERETRLSWERLGVSFAREGFIEEASDGFRLLGKSTEGQDTIEFYWSLPKPKWQRADSWKWASGLQDALSVLSGQTLVLLRREMQLGSYSLIEVRRLAEAQALGICKPFWDDSVDPQRLVRLTGFLAKGGREADTCCRILMQLTDAARQKSTQGIGILVGTCLEAALRTLHAEPYRPRGKRFDVKQALKKFREDWLSDVWTSACQKVEEEYECLRHRNAHPDWLSSPGGALSREEMVRSIDAIILLSHFYGNMILALAGFKDLPPKLPVPHEQWEPMVTVHRPHEDASLTSADQV